MSQSKEEAKKEPRAVVEHPILSESGSVGHYCQYSIMQSDLYMKVDNGEISESQRESMKWIISKTVAGDVQIGGVDIFKCGMDDDGTFFVAISVAKDGYDEDIFPEVVELLSQEIPDDYRLAMDAYKPPHHANDSEKEGEYDELVERVSEAVDTWPQAGVGVESATRL